MRTLLRGGLAALVALSAFAAAAFALSPSPDWRDQVIYQVITDRFANGNTANDNAEGSYNPSDGARTHGGDFVGLRGKLDYLQQLGVTTLWISPVVINTGGEYHGYAAKDLYTISPQMGTKAELQALVADCHARGMYVVIDVVCNHMGTLLTSTAPGYPAYNYPTGYPLSWRDTNKKYPGFFSDPAKFHNYGDVSNWSGTEQVVGAIFGLNDIRTEDASVQAELVAAYRQLIADTDCDGFRVDTVKHVDGGFWDVWCPGIRTWAATQGKSDFLMFGEVFDGDAAAGPFTGTMGSASYRFDSMLWYGMYWTTNGVWGGSTAPVEIQNTYGNLSYFDPTVRERLVTFLDNHDNSRFQGAGVANQDQSRARTAIAWLLTARAIPCLYYGTEQEFDGGSDPWCREDMWAGQWNFGPSLGDNFKQSHSLFRWTRDLIAVRKRHDALRRGALTHLYAEAAGAGLYAIERRSASDTVVVAINSANAPVAQVLATAWPAGTVLVDALEPAVRDTVAAGGVLVLSLGARGARVFESLAAHAVAAAPVHDRVVVTAQFPAHDQSLNDLRSPLVATFDRAVDGATLAASAWTAPAVAGAWQVDGRTAKFFPAAPWPSSTIVSWGFGAALRGADGTALRAPFEGRFRTTAYTSGITVASGFVADRIARQNLGAPVSVVDAPWAGEQAMLVGDVSKDRIFTLTTGGDFGHWLGDSRWTKSYGLVRGSDGRVTVTNGTALYEVDARRVVTPRAGTYSGASFGSLAQADAAWGGQLLMGDPAGNRIATVTAANTLVTFASGVNAPLGMAFGPGGAWGASLYVCDPNYTAANASLDGGARIARVTSGGAVSTFVADATALKGAGALAFDRTGRFGGDLFVADLLNERVLRVTSAGVVSVFATGFGNLSGTQCIGFGPDGALYVADAGSGDSFTRPTGLNAQGQVVRIAPTVLVTGVAPGVASGLRLAPASPNPSGGAVALRWTLAAGGRARLAIYDVSGRHVRTLADGAMTAGEHSTRWDGRDAAGRLAGAGLYFARLEAAGERRTTRVVRLP
ncbi:MAG: alpha-amylase family glycosyl hydrolase [Candidatus Eisenbacteria bacterium]